MRSILCLIPYLIFPVILRAQAEGGIELYNYFGGSNGYGIVPVAHLQSKRGWYGEARYNYDEKNTFSVLGGMTFSGQRKIRWTITPMIGISFGKMDGYIGGVNFFAEKNKFFFNTQSQYTIATSTGYSNYFFNWSELGYQPLKWLYGGFSVQHTQVAGEKGLLEPGVLVGISLKNLSFPFYLFNTFNDNRFYILGINWEWKQ